jgi:hypothetical protein
MTLLAVACTPREKDERPVEHPKAVAPNATSSTPATPAIISGSLAYNIGDVEQGVHLQATIADESKAPNIDVKELADSNKLIRTSTLTVSSPLPEHLWLKFFISLDKMGPEAPVVLRGEIGIGEKGEKVIKPFKYVILKRMSSGENEIKIDIIPALEGNPDSILVGSKAEAILLPANTDFKTVNPDTVTGTPETTATLYSNPLRIKFNRTPENK